MKSLFEKLRAYHQAFWAFDPWYRRAWYGGPSALAVTILAFMFLPGSSAPSGAPWAKPVGGNTSTAQDDPDYKACREASGNHVLRRDACDRVIKSGKLSGKELSTAYFGRGFSRSQTNDRAGAIADYSEAIKLDPTDAMSFNNRGAQQRDNNNIVEALRDFEQAIRLTPNGANALAIANKADILRVQGKLSEAQTEIKKALDVDRNNNHARSIQDKIIADMKALEVAQQAGPDLPLCRSSQAAMQSRGEACDRLIKRGSLPPELMAAAHVGRAWMRENAKDIAGAIADYSETVRLDPSNADAFNNRGGLLLQRGELVDALRNFDEALKVNQRHVWAQANRAEVLRRQGMLAEAQVEIKKAADLNADNARVKAVHGLITADVQKQGGGLTSGSQAPAEPGTETDALRNRATSHYNNKDYNSAIADWTDVIRREGATWLDFNERGRAYLEARQFPQALADFDRAVSRAGHGSAAHFNRALVHERMRDFGRAAKDLDEAISQHGATETDYFRALARNYSSLGDHSRAILTYDKLIDIQDKNKSAKAEDRALNFLLRGRAKKDLVIQERSRCSTLVPPDPNCMSGQRFASALLDLQQALIFRPSYAEAFFENGWIAAEISNPKLSIEEYTKAIRANPNYSMAFNNRGTQYERQKQPELAFADYNDAIRTDQSNKYAWANRGILFAANGQRQRSIDDLSRALKIDETYTYARNNLNRLIGRR
jgi:tetratricopeptide (TPR) repeat protein